MKPKALDVIKTMKNRRICILSFTGLAVLALALFTCSSAQKLDSFTETCAHCHGSKLQGVHNYVQVCGKCHDLKPLAPGDIMDKTRREAVLSEPHIHKNKNMFRPTPSCFNCHRKGDF